MISDIFPSLIRTYVPIGVGVVLTWIAIHFNVVVDQQTQLGIIGLVTGVLSAVYYTIARLLEKQNASFGVLLGLTKQPVYVDPPKGV